jgi:hypothetical protein
LQGTAKSNALALYLIRSRKASFWCNLLETCPLYRASEVHHSHRALLYMQRRSSGDIFVSRIQGRVSPMVSVNDGWKRAGFSSCPTRSFHYVLAFEQAGSFRGA